MAKRIKIKPLKLNLMVKAPEYELGVIEYNDFIKEISEKKTGQGRNIEGENVNIDDLHFDNEYIFDSWFFENITFSNLYFDNCTIVSTTFKNCIFKNCKFETVSMPDNILENCTFEKCHLYQVNIIASIFKNNLFLESVLDECSMTGSDCTQLQARETQFLNHSFIESSINGLNLEKTSVLATKIVMCSCYDMVWVDVKYDGLTITESIFKSFDGFMNNKIARMCIVSSEFLECNFSNLNISEILIANHSKFSKCMFVEFAVDSVIMVECIFEDIIFPKAKINMGSFRRSDFKNTNFQSSILKNLDFHTTKFEDCSLNSADTTGSNFSYVDFIRCDCQDMNVSMVRYMGCREFETKWNGTNKTTMLKSSENENEAVNIAWKNQIKRQEEELKKEEALKNEKN